MGKSSTVEVNTWGGENSLFRPRGTAVQTGYSQSTFESTASPSDDQDKPGFLTRQLEWVLSWMDDDDMGGLGYNADPALNGYGDSKTFMPVVPPPSLFRRANLQPIGAPINVPSFSSPLTTTGRAGAGASYANFGTTPHDAVKQFGGNGYQQWDAVADYVRSESRSATKVPEVLQRLGSTLMSIIPKQAPSLSFIIPTHAPSLSSFMPTSVVSLRDVMPALLRGGHAKSL